MVGAVSSSSPPTGLASLASSSSSSSSSSRQSPQHAHHSPPEIRHHAQPKATRAASEAYLPPSKRRWLNFKGLVALFLAVALLFYFFPLHLFSNTIFYYYSAQPDGPPLLVLSRVLINSDTERGRKCINYQLDQNELDRLNKGIVHEHNDTNSECIHVVMAANREYLPALLASVNSMQINSKRTIHLHVLIGPGDVSIFTRTISDWVDIPVEIVEFNDERVKPIIKVWDGLRFHKNTLNYARFYLPLIFPHLKRIVYIDPDTIVLADIGELHDKLDQHPHNLPNNYLAAVPANLLTFIRSSYAFILSCRDEEIAAAVNCGDDFFNAGVFVTDLDKWRKENITGQSEYWLTQNTKRRLWKWGSQPPLNLVFYRRWSRLEAEWNYRETSRANFDPEMLNYIKIIHFTGHAKPWKTSGGKYWQWWCGYYPRKHELWFCNQEGLQSLMPESPHDFGFLRRTMIDGLREKDFNI